MAKETLEDRLESVIGTAVTEYGFSLVYEHKGKPEDNPTLNRDQIINKAVKKIKEIYNVNLK